MLCFAVLVGKNLKLSEVQAGMQLGSLGSKDMDVSYELDIVKFKSWIKDGKEYFIEVSSPTGSALRFITKNQVRSLIPPLFVQWGKKSTLLCDSPLCRGHA